MDKLDQILRNQKVMMGWMMATERLCTTTDTWNRRAYERAHTNRLLRKRTQQMNYFGEMKK